MNIYEARWKNALAWATKVNLAIARGYTAKWSDHEASNPLIINDDEILIEHRKGVYTIVFRNDPEFDDGSHTNIDDWNEAHEVRFYKTETVGLDEVDFDTQTLLGLIDENRFGLYETYKPIIQKILSDNSVDLNEYRAVIRDMASLMLTETSTYFNRRGKIH